MQSPIALLFCLVALPATALAADPAISAVCGNAQYSSSQVANAAKASCSLIQTHSTAGSSNYPHQYKNYEKINLKGSGPWYEFPILANKVYNGGTPGADRVIISKDCTVAGVITHQGASGQSFLTCTIQQSKSKPKGNKNGAVSSLSLSSKSTLGLSAAAMSYILFA